MANNASSFALLNRNGEKKRKVYFKKQNLKIDSLPFYLQFNFFSFPPHFLSVPTERLGFED